MIQFFEAEAFDATDGVGAFPFSNPTQIGDTDDGDWVRYDNVDFGDDPEALHQITAEVSSGSEGGVIEYRIDAPDGPLLATQRVFNTGGFNRFESVTTALGALSGVHDLYIVFRGTPTSIVDIDSFEITSGIAPPDPNIRFFEAEEFDATHGAGVFGIGDNRVIGSTEAGSWVRYDGVNFGDRTLATHELSMVLGSPNNGGAIEIRVGAPNGALLATQLVPNTGSFGNFTTVATDLGRLTGVQDLFLVFTGPGGSIADVNNFTITTTDPFPPILVQETVEGVEIIEHAPELELAEGTIQFTINAVDNAGRQGLISKDARGFGEGGHLTAWWQHGKVVLRVQTDEASTYLRSDKLALGTDHDVVIGFGLDGVRLFVNGQLVASDTTFTTGLSGNLEPLVLGASQWGSSSETADKIEDTFRGTLSNVAIYDTVLPSEAVATLSGLAPLTFEGPRDRTLRLDGAPVTVASLEDAVILDHSPELELDAGTLFIAFTPESTEGRQGVVSKDAFRLGEGGHLTVWYRDGDVEARLQSDSGQTILRSGPVSVGEEHEVAVTFGEQGFRLYVDGVLAAEDRDFTSGLQGNREPVVIGASQWGSSAETADELVDPFAGEISDVHFYDIALSPEIIADSAPLARDSLLEPGEIRSPAGSGAVYVEDFGAIADDGIDDTAAIRAALELATDNRSSQKLVVFGKGTYDVSDTVSPARPLREDGTRDGFIGRIDFQGAGQDLTEIRLADGLDFQGALVDFGNPGGSADAFHNNIRDLTINIGSGNAAATGLIYTSNNTGTVENVTVKSEDGGGLYGIDLLRIVNNGPHLIQDVTIEGFDYGLFLSGGESTHILESLTFIGQNEVGIFDNTSNFIWARDLDFQDTRQAYANKFNQNADFILLDSRIEASDDVRETPQDFRVAIENSGSTYLREVEVDETFELPFRFNRNSNVHNKIVQQQDDGVIDEFWQVGAYEREGTGIKSVGGAFKLFDDAPETSLGLDVLEHPELVLSQDLDDWVSIGDFGATAGITGNRNGNLAADDDTAGIQAAIDAAAAAGATTVYVPEGEWVLNGTVQVHGSVQHFIGLGGEILGNGTIEIVDGDADTVFIKGLRGRLTNQPSSQVEVLHNTDRTLAVEDTSGWRYRAALDETTGETLAGDLFLNNIVTGRLIVEEGQNVWARQLNIEGRFEVFDNPEFDVPFEAKIVNNGGKLWALGFKTEATGTHVLTRNDGKTEIFGNFQQSGPIVDQDGNRVPQFITIDADFSFVAGRNGFDDNPNYGSVLEIRDGEAREGRINADLYSAIRPETIASDRVIVDNGDPGFSINEVEGVLVEEFVPREGGFIGSSALFVDSGSGVSLEYEADLDPGQ